MEVKILKVIERHQILMLALRKQISQIKAAEELGLSLSHTKLLMRKLKKAEGEGVECRPYRSRTCDTLIKSQVLYQLS